MSSFPPPPCFTATLHTLSHQSVHPDLSDADAAAKLVRIGDFLFRSLPSTNNILLSLRVDKRIHDFDITIKETKNEASPYTLGLGSHRFRNIDEMISHAIKGGFSYRGDILNFVRVIPRDFVTKEPPIGHWWKGSMVPRCGRNGMNDDGRLPCSLLAPISELSKKITSNELEELITLKHESILQLQDYARLSTRALLLRFETYEISIGSYLRKSGGYVSSLQRLQWINNVVSALSFLINKGIYDILLTGETIVLQDTDSLSLKIVTIGSEIDGQRYWKWTAPEYHTSHHLSPLSLVWSFAVFIWQLYTNYSMMPFSQFMDCQFFLHEGESLDGSRPCPLLILPHSLDHNQLANPKYKKYYTDYGKMMGFPQAPSALRELFSSCLIWSIDSRSTWSKIKSTVHSEYTVARLANIIDKIIP